MDSDSILLNKQVYKDDRGRYRDKKTHRYVKKEIVENILLEISALDQPENDTSLSQKARAATQKHLHETVVEEGIPANDPAEAWGHLISVQTQIAMDAEKGSKATSAAKFIGKVTGLLQEDEQKTQENKALLGRKLAEKLLNLISKEKSQRD